MNFKTTTLLFLALLNTYGLFACSCFPVPDFCSSVSDYNYVILGVVTEKNAEVSCTVEIIENLHRTIPNERITLFGGNGFFTPSCVEAIDDIQLGDTVVLSLYRDTDNNFLLDFPEYSDLETDSTYLRSFCGNHKLIYSNGMLTNQVYPDIASMTYADFVDQLQACISLTTNTLEVEEEATAITIAPNPVGDNMQVISNGERIKRLEMYRIDGQQMKVYDNINEYDVQVSTQGLPAGMYILAAITEEDKIMVKKLSKLND